MWISALRHAQALGMHRDPGWRKWEEMHAVDRELRTTSWWLLIICDRSVFSSASSYNRRLMRL